MPFLCASAFLQLTPTNNLINNRVGVCLPAKSLRRKGNKASSAGGGKKNTRRQEQSTKTRNNNAAASSTKGTNNAQTSNKNSSTPPWQVLSTKDAKINVEKEKIRRSKARQGSHHVDEDDDDNHRSQQQTLSTAFLSDTQQKFLNWKRFNPSTIPAGMKFVGSYLDRRLPPPLGVPEVAFLGRSNVGKSSLLNRLSAAASTQQQQQARVGKTPGATASVNLYALMDKHDKNLLGWADLPGFGYAKLSKQVQEAVQAAAENYLGKRQELCLGILLVDIRRQVSEDDCAVLAALYDLDVPLVVVATKIDKVSKNELSKCLQVINQGLGLPEGQPLAISSATGQGTRELWKIIMEACEEGVRSKKVRYDEETRKQKEMEEKDDVDDDMLDDFDDEDDILYSQGYDWVHGGDSLFYGQGEFDKEEDHDDDVHENENSNRDASWNDFEEFEDELKPQRETFQDLQRRARGMEKRGEL